MDLNFSFEKEGLEEIYIPKAVELWTPVEEGPMLSENEMSFILQGEEVLESLHVAIPTLLIKSEDDTFGYIPCFELDKYFIIGKLKNSSYQLFYQEKKSSKKMQNLLKQGFLEDRTNFYFFDAFYEPFFGGISPKHHLFQQVSFDTVPETMILFKDIDLEKSDFNRLFMK